MASKSTLEYAWDFPAGRNKKLVLNTVDGGRRVLDILEIGDLVPFKFAVSVTISGAVNNCLNASTRPDRVNEQCH